MRKNVLLFILCGVIMVFSVAAIKSDAIQATLFPSKVTLYNQLKESLPAKLSSEEVINYKGKAYVPLRSFSEAMGAVVDYGEPSEQSGQLHKIDIYQKLLEWKLYGLDPEMQICDESPITITVERGNQEKDKNYSFDIRVFNYMEQDIRIEPIQLEFEIYASDYNSDMTTGDVTDRVYRSSIPTLEGLVPSKYGYELSVHWNQTGMDGKELPSGWYMVSITRPDEVNFYLSGDETKQTEKVFSSMGCNLNYFWIEVK